jgi:hypothetical protein
MNLLFNNFSSQNEEILSEKAEERGGLSVKRISRRVLRFLQPKFQIGAERIIK